MVEKGVVVGCGKMGRRHLEAYSKIGGVKIIGLVDKDLGLAEKLGEEYGVCKSMQYFDSFNEADFVDVCTPTVYHREIVAHSLSSGFNVFCEKPLATTVREVEELISLKGSSTVQVGYLYRFHPVFEEAKKIIENGVIGKPLFAFARIGAKGSHAEWKHDAGSGGGCLNDMGVHLLDLCNWFFGEPTRVKSLYSDTLVETRTVNQKEFKANAEDISVLKLVCGDVTVLVESDFVSERYTNFFEVHGSNGSVFASLQDFFPSHVNVREPAGKYVAGRHELSLPAVGLMEKQLDYFIKTTQGLAAPVNTLEDSLRVARILEKVK